MELTAADRDVLGGGGGEGAALAMRLVVALGGATGADRLIDVGSAHVDGCLYHGQVSLDFAERLAEAGGRVRIPTTLNVGSVDLIHPELFRGDEETAHRGRRLMELYVGMGCRPTFTCAPYQLPTRPAFGEHVAWAESNAIVFANSVLGARTERYGDFIDICAAITGRVPDAGLHRSEHRAGEILFRLDGIPQRLLADRVLFPLVGHVVGARTGARVPVIDGLPSSADEDDLKALGAAAASSGSVALFHAVGATPEAPSLEVAFGGREPADVLSITAGDLREARDSLSTASGDRLDAVSIGTPHLSIRELERLVELLDGVRFHPDVQVYASMGRDTLAAAEARGWLPVFEHAGLRLLVDTCTYVTRIIPGTGAVVMTDSAKWAYYAPGNIGARVVFGSLEECLRSAAAGGVRRDERLWSDR
ncbi:MAG: aconitase X [Actinomycetota bacterium]